MNDVTNGQWATFFINQEQYAVAVEDVQEVLLTQPVTPVPLAPPEIVGLINLRGAVMPAIDLRVHLGLPPTENPEARKLMVLDLGGAPLSIVVDDIGDVFELPPDGWRPPPETLGTQRDAIFGVFPRTGHIILGLKTSAFVQEEVNA